MLREKTFYSLLFLFILFFGKGQNKNIDSYLLIDKAVKKLYQNPDDCINFSQGFSTNSKDVEEKIILQNIMSQAFAMKGDFVQSIKTSLENNSSSNANYSSFTQLFTEYSLAEQYQNLALYGQSEKIINGILSSKKYQKSSDPNIQITFAKILQLKAINLAITKKTKESLDIFAESNLLLKGNNNENTIIKNENELLISSILLSQNKIDEAKEKIEKVLEQCNGKEYFFLEALANEALARIYFLKNENTTALSLLEKANNLISKAEYLPLKSRIYEMMSKNYSVLQNTAQYQYYNKLYLDSKLKLDGNKKDGIRYLIKLVETEETNNLAYIEKTENSKNWMLILFCIAAIIALSFILYYQKNTSKGLQKQLDFFEGMKTLEKSKKQTAFASQPAEMVIVSDETEKAEKKPVLISKEKEKEILAKLVELENSDRFLNKNMSLATLAGQLDTNTKYLSEIINNYKGKNFNSYINELRINHIALLLKTNPSFLNYKVSYLAEFSGFSSHSAFTTVFKSVTGMSPNAYIQQINQTKK